MPSDHPFQLLFETFGQLPVSHSEEVNRQEREELRGWLEVPLEDRGHCILLKASRAGYGKTHLLTHLQHELGGSHEFVPLHAIGGSRIDAATVLNDILRRLVRALPAAGGLSVLDLVTRRLFSSSLQPLVNSGEVPCQDREGALGALKNRPIETFDFHHPGAVTAHWARENFELVGPRLALELSQRNGLPLREVSFWVDALFRFAATPVDNPGRVQTLSATVFDDPSAEAVAHERLIALLGMLTALMRLVLVADELEGFSSDETAALRFASFFSSLRQSVDRVDVILSINQDVWESAFLPRLSSGLADRLTEVVIELQPLDHQTMIAILESRSPGFGQKILDQTDASAIATHARGLLREAGGTWERAAAEKKAQEEKSAEKGSSLDQLHPGEAQQVDAPKDPVREPAAQNLAENSANPAPYPATDRAPAPVPQQTSHEEPAEPSRSVSKQQELPPTADRPPPPEQVRPVPQPASDESSERVDDLLNQFRERYGKSSA